MQPDFKYNAAILRQKTGSRPLGLRVRLGWIAVCLLSVCIAITFVQPVLATDTGAKTATNIVSSGSWSTFTVGNLNANDAQRATNGQE